MSNFAPVRFLVCGSRNWTDYTHIRYVLQNGLKLYPMAALIHGGARGADSLADRVWRRLAGKEPFVFEAPWEEYKKLYPVEQYGSKWKSAGTDRNQKMLDVGEPDIVLAFFQDRSKSPGTNDMVRRAVAASVPVWWYDKKTRKEGGTWLR